MNYSLYTLVWRNFELSFYFLKLKLSEAFHKNFEWYTTVYELKSKFPFHQGTQSFPSTRELRNYSLIYLYTYNQCKTKYVCAYISRHFHYFSQVRLYSKHTPTPSFLFSNKSHGLFIPLHIDLHSFS